VLLGLECEGIHVDTLRWGASVVLEWLHTGEVSSLTLSESVLAVELELGNFNWVLTFALDSGVEDNLCEEVVGRVLEDNLLILSSVGVKP
jgi:hypothetical protein